MADFVNVTTKMFFDRAKVIRAMDRKSHRVLSSTGAFGRKVMRNGMRRRKKISDPGQFPSAHSGELKEFIYFGFDGKDSVVIGPTLLHRGGTGRDREHISGNKTVPQLVNEGGDVVRHRAFGRGRTFRRFGKPERLHYRPRPFVALTTPIAAKKLAENMAKFEFK